MSSFTSLRPLHQYYVSGTPTALSTTSTEVTESGVYLLSSGGTVTYVLITDAPDASTTPDAENSIALEQNASMPIFIKAQQYIKRNTYPTVNNVADVGDGGTYTLLKAY